MVVSEMKKKKRDGQTETNPGKEFTLRIPRFAAD